MRIYNLNSLSAEEIQNLTKRPGMNLEKIFPIVREIQKNVQENGDNAVRMYTMKFDGVQIKNLKVTENEFREAEKNISPQVKKAIRVAMENIEKFHTSQISKEKPIETMPGIMCFRENRAIEKIGLYIPGGTAPLFSTVLMLGIPAKIAECKNVILCTPPNHEGKIAPEILFSAKECGIFEVYKVGGAQAIGAMAYGTETIPKVDKIFGPGNQFVTAAKMLISIDPNGAAIDMPAGPSEVLVITDGTANPSFIASDLLSQAEHGEDSQVVFVTTDSELIPKIQKEIDIQLKILPRKSIAKKSLKKSFGILLRNMEQAFEFSNLYAPEHLIVNVRNPEKYISKIQNAGSVFLGEYAPESAGDYASGTNHTLPTSGFARSYSGISVESFLKKITFQSLTKQGLENIAETVITMSEAERLQAHANAVQIRRE